MSPSNPNTAWAAAIIDELARGGVRVVSVAPGSRCTPLVLAASRHPVVRIVTHLDERSAGFFALGIGKVTETPAAVITTSGTAVANLLPAIVEAAQSDTPLVALTADRPAGLRGTDANQTIDQGRIFGIYARAFAETPVATAEPQALRALRSVVNRTVQRAIAAPAGPVHLNCPFARPLEPDPAEVVGAAPWPDVGRSPPAGTHAGRATPDALDALAEHLRFTARPLVVAGPLRAPDAAGPALRRLAANLKAPIVADPLSGVRFGPGACTVAITHYDAFLRDEQLVERLTPDLVLRFGATPTSGALADALRYWEAVPQIVIDEGWRWKDHTATAHRYVRADPALTAEALVQRSMAARDQDQGWLSAWRGIDTVARNALWEGGAGDPFEATAVTAVLDALPPGANLVIGNSMPIRDLDRFSPPREESVRVWGNRGASGIDGLVSTALGVAAASDGPTVALVGDISFYHDQAGLFAARALPPVVYVVINNDGGGIFELLPVREFEPAFTDHVAVPHGFEFHHVAALHGLPYRRVTLHDDIRAAVREALERGVTAILEIPSNRAHNRRRHLETLDAVREAVRNTSESGAKA